MTARKTRQTVSMTIDLFETLHKRAEELDMSLASMVDVWMREMLTRQGVRVMSRQAALDRNRTRPKRYRAPNGAGKRAREIFTF